VLLVTAPPHVGYAATLQPIGWHGYDAPRSGSWSVTHPLGKPAGGTYTEVAFDPGCVARLTRDLTPADMLRVLDEVVRLVAGDLYGIRWAFHYPPEQYADAIERHRMRRRELVIVTAIDVYDLTPERNTP
jgi:hypothetical protein